MYLSPYVIHMCVCRYHESLVRVGQSGGGKSDDLSRYFMTSTDKSRCILSPAVHPLGGPNALKSDAGAVADMEANVPPQNSLCTLFDMVLHPQMLLHLMLKCYSADDYQKVRAYCDGCIILHV